MKLLAGERLAIFSGQQRVDWRLCSEWRRVPAGASLLPPPTYSYIGWCPRPTLLRQSQLCLERSHHYEVFGEC